MYQISEDDYSQLHDHKSGLRWRHFHIDMPLFAAIIIGCVFGLVVLYSATGQDMGLMKKQQTFMLIGLVGMLIIAQIPPNTLRMTAVPIFIVCLLLVIAVKFYGVKVNGARRWINIGMTFQPSEFLKIATPMLVAAYLHYKTTPPNFLQQLFALILIAIPMGFVGAQPDFGTAFVIGLAGISTLFLAGLSWWLIGIASALVGLAIFDIALWLGDEPSMFVHQLFHEYHRERLTIFLDPELDPNNNGYQIIQSMIAIGSGGLFGKGWLNGTQSQLEFLPERDTDFIFAVLAEEFGLMGLLPLLALYLFIFCRGMYIAAVAKDTFSRLLAGGFSFMFFIYVFVNCGMVTGLLPVIGIPLPLVSRGGTFMIMLLLGFGILMSIHTHRKT